ncbi:MAG TPA: CHAT domain-containing tetratricopeptide repeat protein, partial [Pyrinomonadaceae bacterium]|nr:CHAT domain-containing tetratricopeptide repeat protein [Pyrinomonadaceae bacterium]
AFAEAQKLRAQRRRDAREAAVKKYREALSQSEQIGDAGGRAVALLGLGNAYFNLGMIREALASYGEALPLFRAAADRVDEATTLLLIGMTKLSLGRSGEALSDYEQALDLFTAVDDRKQIGFALSELGRAYYAEGDGARALHFYQRALDIRRQVGDRRGEAFSLNVIGRVHFYVLADHEKALDHYRQALAIHEEVKDPSTQALNRNDMGRLFFSQGNRQEALAQYHAALALQESSGDLLGKAETLSYIGLVHTAEGRHDTALELYGDALKIQRERGDRIGEGNTLHYMGDAYASRGDNARALEHLRTALGLWERVLHRSAEADTRFGIARVEMRLGDLDGARRHLEPALRIVESLRTKIANQHARASYFAAAHRYYELYTDLLMLLFKQTGAKEYEALALSASESARGRSLLDTLIEARAGIRKGASEQLLTKEAALQRRISVLAQRQMLGGEPSREQLDLVSKTLRSLLSEYHDLEARIRVESPRYAELTRPTPPTLEQIQGELLEPEQMLLQFALGEERSYLWAVTRSQVKSYVLPPRAEIERAAELCVKLLTARNRSVKGEDPLRRLALVRESDAEYGRAAAGLSEMTLGQVEVPAGVRRLLVVGDGALQYVPFAALPTPRRFAPAPPATAETGAAPVPLLFHYEIDTQPSMSLVAQLRRESPAASRRRWPKQVAVIADPVFNADDERVVRPQGDSLSCRVPVVRRATPRGARAAPPPEANGPARSAMTEAGLADEQGRIARLLFTRREACNILSLAKSDGMAALGFSANRRLVTDGTLSRYRILHFATHSLLNKEHPEVSGILLSMLDRQRREQNGFVQMHEIYNLDLPAELVVLSACETGIGKEIKGEGLAALSRAFIYAGARRVVASLWAVNDASTAELMDYFYQHLLAGPDVRPGAALRAAQLRMWRQNPGRPPYFWAAFIAQGDTR